MSEGLSCIRGVTADSFGYKKQRLSHCTYTVQGKWALLQRQKTAPSNRTVHSDGSILHLHRPI